MLAKACMANTTQARCDACVSRQLQLLMLCTKELSGQVPAASVHTLQIWKALMRTPCLLVASQHAPDWGCYNYNAVAKSQYCDINAQSLAILQERDLL